MILTDTGPLVALLDKADPHHSACVDVLRRLPPDRMLTTWPCLTEAMHLLKSAGGYRYQAALWDLRSADRLVLHDLTAPEADHMAELMATYRKVPMDLADASLVAAAESLSIRHIFTSDSDFYIYRFRDGTAFEILQ